jgi:hypothetical protein
MANYVYLQENETLTASIKYLASSEHKEAAEKALVLLKQFDAIKVAGRIQKPAGNSYTCWYVYLKTNLKTPVINFGLYRNGVLNVEFRFVEQLPPNKRIGLEWVNNKWMYARVSRDKYTVDQVSKLLDIYIPNVSAVDSNGKLKKGGTSFAETIIFESLCKIYGAKKIKRNEKPEWLRTPKKTLIELDLTIAGECSN